MAHELEIAKDGKASMLYVGETPWHHLGTRLETPPATVEEAIKLAGLDWTVSTQQLQLADGRPVGRWATVRDKDAAILGTVGPGYRVVQNAAAFKFFDPFIAGGGATIETAGSLRGGSRVWMLAKVARPDSVIVKKSDDRVAKYLLLAQGHDGSLAIHVGITPVRVVCANTLSAAIPAASGERQRRTGDVSADGMFRIRHVANAQTVLTEVQSTIEKLDHDFERAADFFRSLAGKNIRSAAKLRGYFEAVFQVKPKKAEPTAPKVDALALIEDAKRDTVKAELIEELAAADHERRSRIADEVMELFESGQGNDLPGVRGTAWAAYNAVTEYMTHKRGASPENRMINISMGGSGAPQRAVTLAQKLLLSN